MCPGNGEGYREVQYWLFKVLALRLRRLEVQKGTDLYSSGTEQKSFTILPPILAGTSLETSSSCARIPGFETAMLSIGSYEPVSGPQMTSIWHQNNTGPTASQPTLASSRLMVLDSTSNGSNDLNQFRQLLFENMGQAVMQTYQSGFWDIYSFWYTVSDRLSQLQVSLQGQSESILLFYYRVSPLSVFI